VPEPGAPYERIVGDVDLPFGAIYFLDASRVLSRDYYVLGLEPRLTARATSGRLAHTIDAGLRVLAEGADLEELGGAHKGAMAGPLIAAEQHATIAFAAYCQDRVTVVDELVVTPGVRVEHARYQRTVDVAPGLPAPAEGGSGTTAFIPGIGVTAGVPEAHAFAGMHVGFAPPRITTAISEQGQTEELDAERSTNWEVGVRTRPAAWQRAEATFFLQRFVNQIVPQTTPGGTTELVNGGATRSLGAELAAITELGRAFDVPHAFDLGVRAGVLRATFEEGPLEGHVLPYAPPYTVSATADVDFDFGFGFGAAVTRVAAHFADDESTLLPDATGRVGEIPGYTLLDVSARYRDETTGLGSSVNIKNVLDQPFVIARRPEGIHVAGFRQVVVSVWWDIED
jgi:Fe(3+) dicitrate transport protein